MTESFLTRANMTCLLLAWMRLATRGHCLPIHVLLTLRKFAAKELAKLPCIAGQLTWDCRQLQHPVFSKEFSKVNLSSWSIDVETLNYIIRLILRTRPQTLLEFGSGWSTVFLARIMTELYDRDQCVRVYSVEQDAARMLQLQGKLEQMGLIRVVRLIHAPLREQTIEGIRTWCYDFGDKLLGEAIKEVPPGLVLIDGPSGGGDRRFGVLPLVHAYLKDGTPFLLDDALRDGELHVAKEWAKLPYISICGIRLIGKGVLTGTVRNRS